LYTEVKLIPHVTDVSLDPGFVEANYHPQKPFKHRQTPLATIGAVDFVISHSSQRVEDVNDVLGC
jgi:hypothetical protein